MKHKCIFLLVVVLLTVMTSFAFAVTQTELNTEINHILASAPTDLNVGIIIENAATGKILYEKNPNRLFVPASNMKLVTAYAALNVLGPDFIFHTTIYADTNKIVNGVLHGNVYLQFSADPSLTSAQVNSLIGALTQAGIKKIDGQFIIVDKSFDQLGYGPGWMWDDVPYCDGEPVHGIVINHNCFTTNIYSGSVGAPTISKIASSAVPFPIDNQVITANDEQHCYLMVNSNNLNQFVIQGCINQNKIPHQLELSINGAHAYATELVKQDLRDHHIELTGTVQLGNLANSVNPLLAINSKPLPGILADMLKPSDNLYANVLFKKTGQKMFNGLGTWNTGTRAVKDVLETQLHINPKSLVIVDGSGTSRYDLLTASQLLALLNSVYKNPTFYPIFLEALPHSGFKGTLVYRMNKPGILGHVIAKTGSMTGISSLSGYIKTAHNQTLIFVMLMNNFVGKEHPYRALQDKICDYLWQQEF